MNSTTIPDYSIPFREHRVEFTAERNGDMIGDCPFCQAEGKFSVNILTGKWRCWRPSCESGNVYSFIEKFWKMSMELTTDAQLSELAQQRSFIGIDGLREWGVCKGAIEGKWIIPAFNQNGVMVQLYRYTSIKDKKDGTYYPVLIPTKGINQENGDTGVGGDPKKDASKDTIKHGMFGVKIDDKDIKHVIIAEGPWDGIAIWEAVNISRIRDEMKTWPVDLMVSNSMKNSLSNHISVIATPGANIWGKKWYQRFSGRHVLLPFDSDYPKVKRTGVLSEPTGYAGAKRVASILYSMASESPASISYVKWGPSGYDPELPDGYDSRDLITERGETPEDRVLQLSKLFSLSHPFLSEEVPVVVIKESSEAPDGIEPESCGSWKELVAQWSCQGAMEWHFGLDICLSSMLAVVSSVPELEDQLWIKVVGPPASGKTTLAEAVSVARKHVYIKSKFRGLYSGHRDASEPGKDHSLILKLKNKTLIVKDADTLLQEPAARLGDIMSQLRDAYDRNSSVAYLNSIDRSYSQNMGVILCGTNSIRLIDRSCLGARFVDVLVMEKIDDAMEDKILLAKVEKTFRNIQAANGKDKNGGNDKNQSDSLRYPPQVLKAMKMTGGYVEHLCTHAHDMVREVKATVEVKKLICDMGLFVAHVRARMGEAKEAVPERELATRLTGQLSKLALFTAVVLQKKEIDDEVVHRVKRIVLGTSRGHSFGIIKALYKNKNGLLARSLGIMSNTETRDENKMLRFLKGIGVVDFHHKDTGGEIGDPKWVLTPKMRRIYEEVTGA